MHRLRLLGLNHATAPLAVREKLAFNAHGRRAALEAFAQRFPKTEAVLLSTCNRVELYVAGGESAPEADHLGQFLAALHGIAPSAFAEQVAPHLYHKAGRGVVEHLFAVASSLDSMVLGETQILGQVREAYESAKAAGSTGGLLNPLFQAAGRVAKRVMSDTALNEGRLSVASVAVEFARRIFDHFGDKTVLSVGAGKMASLVLQHFAALSPRKLLVCNRHAERAGELAGKFGGEAVAFDKLAGHLVAADIVVTSTGAPHPIVTRQQVEALRRGRRYRPLFLIDIALPRDVEEAVGKIDNVYLYNIDDLQQVVSQTQSGRTAAVEAARKLVAAAVDDFAAWHRTREMGPLIDALYKKVHRLAQDEVARTVRKLPNVNEAERAHLDELAHRLANKLLNDPLQTLRRTAGTHGPSEPYLHALEKLFNLGEETKDEEA